MAKLFNIFFEEEEERIPSDIGKHSPQILRGCD